MSQHRARRALISVYDKTGLVAFARALQQELGFEILSTGGTARHLTDAGIAVRLVEDVTGFPEMLDGRVKTLHPRIHAAILADRDNPEHMRQLAEQGIQPIDLVVVNLYPFEDTVARPDCTLEQAIEMIDIGGPCLLRAAAKNHRHVRVVSGPGEYEGVLESLRSATDAQNSMPLRLASRAFEQTCRYDAAIATWLTAHPQNPDQAEFRAIHLRSREVLRYGENPHQQAEVCSLFGLTEWLAAKTGGPDLSYNNLVDAGAALELCAELTRWYGESPPVACFIKHTNPCGVGVAEDAVEAYRRAYLGDPNAAMGGILAVNFRVDAAFAEAVMDSLQRWGKAAGAGAFFVEVWLAPSFGDDAVQVVRTRKPWGSRVRLMDVGDGMSMTGWPEHVIRSVPGNLLIQSRDAVGLNESEWRVVTDRAPDERELADLRLAWLVCKHTKSNAISICRDDTLIGNGAGQMSRVMSCRIATWAARENGHTEALAGAVAASDAFFPFRDGPDILMDAGVTAIIQPGGSKRDEDVIRACNERRAAMIFTGTRHFRH